MDWLQGIAVEVDGRDVSNSMRPRLMSCEINDRPGTVSDSAELLFDDMRGDIALPPAGRDIIIRMQGRLLFGGIVDDVRSSSTKQTGRLLRIGARSFDTRGKGKERQAWHMDDGTIGEFLEKAARRAGFEIKVDPAFASIRLEYQAMKNQSFIAKGQQLAKEYGATFKIRGKQAVLAAAGTGNSPSGAALPIVTGSVPGNVISWDIEPFVGRARYTSARVRYFDRAAAMFKTETIEIQPRDEGPEVVYEASTPAATAEEARAYAEAMKREVGDKGGGGTVVLQYVEDAMAEGRFNLIGARPGIDGTYRIEAVRHQFSRATGSLTTLEITQPQGEAGKDSRVPVPTPRPAA